jgi:hypothetical protein
MCASDPAEVEDPGKLEWPGLLNDKPLGFE